MDQPQKVADQMARTVRPLEQRLGFNLSQLTARVLRFRVIERPQLNGGRQQYDDGAKGSQTHKNRAEKVPPTEGTGSPRVNANRVPEGTGRFGPDGTGV